jgi:hypothetical protein
MTLRQRYYVAASVAFVMLGMVIVVRSVAARVLPVGLLGAVFIALGMVRLKDFFRR